MVLWAAEVAHRRRARGLRLNYPEAVLGGGKVIRESMGQSVATRASGTPDLVITGAIVLDHRGVANADVGIRDGRVVAVGKAGNPETMAGVDPRLVIGPPTEVLSGNGKSLTAGTIDSQAKPPPSRPRVEPRAAARITRRLADQFLLLCRCRCTPTR